MDIGLQNEFEERPTILGSYRSARGGRLYINLSDNAQYGLTGPTYIHEACHAWLSGTTPLGILQNIMEMEVFMAEEEDAAYARDRAACGKMLMERTRFVQEVFANNIELLTLEEQCGQEEMLRALAGRTKEYQGFYVEMMPVHHQALTSKEKTRHIHALCAYAMDATLPQGAARCLETLSAALSGPYAPKRRLESALEAYRRTGMPPAQDSEDAYEAKIRRMTDMVSRYTRPYFHEAFQTFFKTDLCSDEVWLTQTLQEQMLKKVCLFDPAVLRFKRRTAPSAAQDVFLVLKRVQNLIDEESFYLITYDKGYNSAEISPAELERGLNECLCVCTLFSEYDPQRARPEFFDPGKALLTVMLQTYAECEQWLRLYGTRGTLYTGDLRLVCAQTDVSILFFCHREQPQTVFLFPTLGVIRDRLMNSFDLKRHLYAADDRAFLKLFSHLGNEVEMMRYLQGILALLLDRPWETLIKSGPLSQLAASTGRVLFDSALAFKRPDHFKILAALPQKETQGAPLYVLMRFEGGESTVYKGLHRVGI